MIEITYTNFDKLTEVEMESLTKYIDYCLEILMKKEISSKKKLSINFTRGLDSGLGETNVEDSQYREFSITVATKLKGNALLESIGHELVHVKQWSSGDLQFTSNIFISLWKGRKVDDRKVQYWLLPWEIEAYGYEKCLIQSYLLKLKNK